MMQPDSDDDMSVSSDGSGEREVPNLPTWMQRGSGSYATSETSEATPSVSDWVQAPSAGGGAAYSDHESASSHSESGAHDLLDMSNSNNNRPRLSNWIRPSGGSYSAPSDNHSESEKSNNERSRSDRLIASDIANWQDNNRQHFRDLEHHENYQPPNSNRIATQEQQPVNSGLPNDTFLDEGVVGDTPYGQGHRHGATVYDDWGLPISNPSNFREGRNMCRPWLVMVNLFAISLVIGIIVHGGPASGYERGRYNWLGQRMDAPETTWGFMGEELVGPIPEKYEAENRLVGFGHHVTMNEKGDRIAIARTSGHRETPGEVYVYSWRMGISRKHNHPPKPGKWRLEQILRAQLEDGDQKRFHTGQQHTPLAMSASGHRIAFTEGDNVYIFESSKAGELWKQIAKVRPLDHDEEDEAKEQIAMETAKIKEIEAAAEEKEIAAAEAKEEAKNEASTITKGGLTAEHKALNAELNGALGGSGDEEEDENDDDDDDGVEEGGRRKLNGIDWERGGDHFGKHLAFSHDGRTLAVMGYSKAKGGYIRVFMDVEEDIRDSGHEEHKHIFEATPDIFLEEVGDSLALSGDGKTLCIGIATSDDLGNSGTHNGVVQVFGLGADHEWYRIGQPIFGDYPMEGFGGSVSLSENGMVLAAGVAYGGGPVKIYQVKEVDHFGKKWIWNQMGQKLHGANHREHFGSQVKLNYDGTLVAIGAPGSPELLDTDEPIEEEFEEYLHGRAYVFGFDAEASEWTDAGRAISAYQGDAFGYSLAISGGGDRVVIGAPFRTIDDEVNVGVVEVFAINA